MQIDAVAAGLCDGLDSHLDGLLDTVDAMQPGEILACLDAMAAAAAAAGPADDVAKQPLP